MKTDKILFGAACLAMGLITYSTMEKGTCEPYAKQHRIYTQDTLKLKPSLMTDTISFSNPDTLKMAKQLMKH